MAAKILLAALLLLVLFILAVAVVDTNRFHVVTYRIAAGDREHPVRAVFLSDLHDHQYGKGNAKLLEAIDGLGPDCILIGGDLLTAHPGRDVQKAIALTKALCEKYPVYYGSGNHEQRLGLYPERYPGMSQVLEEGIKESGARRLINESCLFEKEGRKEPLIFSSVEIERHFYKRGRAQTMTGEQMEEMIQPPEGPGYRILLAHNPDYFSAYRAWGADLVLAGHVHGGVVRIPFLGGLVSPRICLFPKYDGGLFEEEGKKMIVSRGLGSHTIPIRVFNPGELVELIIE